MIRLLPGDCRTVLATLPADSVQCVVTSPPYYGLRDYGTAQWDGGDAACSHVERRTRGDAGRPATLVPRGKDGALIPSGSSQPVDAPMQFRATCGRCGAVRVDRQIGLEATPDEYLATMVAVFREVRRVLRSDGTCWVNMGDSYANNGTSGLHTKSATSTLGPNGDGLPGNQNWNVPTPGTKTVPQGLKPKDLLLMPARLALALQADGWWVRSDIIWHKPNPMPESCGDRPTSAHEHVFLLTKSARYFYDADAVREAHQDNSIERVRSPVNGMGGPNGEFGARVGQGGKHAMVALNPAGRNLRNVWTIATAPYSQAHFATYPPALAERCIKAGTSERGCCSQCGKPWVRTTERSKDTSDREPRGKALTSPRQDGNPWNEADGRGFLPTEIETTGWRAGCDHEAPVAPCTVLDPFAGAGTTLLVADRLQRDAVGVELNVEYTRMAMGRCRDDAPLLADLPPAADPEDERMADLFAEAAE